MIHRMLLGLGIGLALSACQQYDFSVNERVVYSPRPLLTDFRIPDPALRACVERTINDNRISSVGQLQELACSGANIVSLEGLGHFSSLTRVDLAGNAIADISELRVLLELRALLLDDNRIEDASPLYRLPELSMLSLEGNNGLRCPGPEQLQSLQQLTLPRHCR
jgi:Leucine-rich repeat (LRR) protein